MRKAEVFMHGEPSGVLVELEKGKKYRFSYFENYPGEPVSLTMPVKDMEFEFDEFPPFFDGLLPEGFQLEALLKQKKIDRDDLFIQLITVGEDLVGAVTIKESDE